MLASKLLPIPSRHNVQRGIRFSVDVGQSRIGLARTDPDATMALPVATIKMSDTAINEVADTINEYEAIVVYVGLPLSLSGEHTLSTQHAVDFATALNPLTPADIRLVDERLSTVSAASALRATGHTAQSSKGIIDQAAAVVILEHAIDLESKRNEFAGQAIGE
jgi:putative Holliday junction resolvase